MFHKIVCVNVWNIDHRKADKYEQLETCNRLNIIATIWKVVILDDAWIASREPLEKARGREGARDGKRERERERERELLYIAVRELSESCHRAVIELVESC